MPALNTSGIFTKSVNYIFIIYNLNLKMYIKLHIYFYTIEAAFRIPFNIMFYLFLFVGVVKYEHVA